MLEYDKMKANIPFDPSDEQLVSIRTRMREAELIYNGTKRTEKEKRTQILKEVLGACGEGIWMLPNIHFDYGCNIEVGKNFFCNINSTFIDVARISIGDNVLIGPNVTICTATHPIVADERMPQKGEDGKEYMLEYSRPVTIGNQVWIGAGVIVNPGVTIGDRAVIGSGSVVTKDIPNDVVAAGVPCRVVRKITDSDKLAVKGW